MSFIFWDTETTGISTDFDQILQFAAVLTDDDLNELDRIELRCRLHPHVVPTPGALSVTGISVSRILDRALPCHYEMIRSIRAKLIEWSPATFVGYNSLRFDEELLRKALFRTLHSPYLTNTNGNGRADALSLVQAASVLDPGSVRVPLNEKGKASYKLDRLAPLNGFDHSNAHDAVADVLATIHMVRLVRNRAPKRYAWFKKAARKADVARFLEQCPAVLLTEFYYNRPAHYPVVAFSIEPGNPSKVLAFDLRHEFAEVSRLSDVELSEWLAGSPKPIRGIKLNAAPSLDRLQDADAHFLGAFERRVLLERSDRLLRDIALRQRIVQAYSRSMVAYDTPEHVEEQLYSGGFVGRSDTDLMELFHRGSWEDRAVLATRFEDPRLRFHALRLVYEDHAALLPAAVRAALEREIWGRLVDEECPDGKWCSLPKAISDTEEMLRSGAGQEVILRELHEHLTITLARAKQLITVN